MKYFIELNQIYITLTPDFNLLTDKKSNLNYLMKASYEALKIRYLKTWDFWFQLLFLAQIIKNVNEYYMDGNLV